MERTDLDEPQPNATMETSIVERTESRPGVGARLQGAFSGALVALSSGLGLLVGGRAIVAAPFPGVHGLLALPPIPHVTFGVAWSDAATWPTRMQAIALGRIADLLLALLLAGASVAVLNLVVLLAEAGAARRREIAVRAALGGGPWVVVRLLLRDLRMLFVGGYALGLLLGVLAGAALRAAWPGTLAPVGILSATGELLLPVLVLSGFAALVYAAAGVNVARSAALAATLAAGGRATDPGRAVALRRALSGLQMTVAGSVLCATMVLAATSVRNDHRHAGVARDVSVVPVTAPGQVRGTSWGTILSRLAKVPGLRAESLATPGALVGLGVHDRLRAECDCAIGDAFLPVVTGSAIHEAVGPGFFALTGRKIVAGRSFTAADTAGARPVAIVNRSFADSYLRQKPSVGRGIQIGGGSRSRWYTVVGIVADEPSVAVGGSPQIPDITGHSPRTPPAVYLSALQRPPARAGVILRGPPAALQAAVGALAGAGWSPEKPSTLESWLARSAAPLRWTGTVSFALALLTLVLSIFGVHVTSRQITRRRIRERAVRRAVGATDGQVLRHALAGTLRTALWGGFGSMMGGTFLVGFVQKGMSGVPAPPIWVYLAVAAVLVISALSASWRGAREAVRVQPAAVLE